MFERCLYFNTNVLARKLNARWEQAFARFDLSPAHGYLLRLVLSEPGQSQQAIAAELRLDKSTVTRFLNQLEGRGLVARRASPADQRERVIEPTAAALALQSQLEALGDELYESLCATLGRGKLEQLVASLREVAAQL